MSIFRSRAVAAVLGAVLTGSVVGGVAIAQSSSPPPTITACVHKQTGAVRVVAAATDCNPSETSLMWNQQGIQGSQGPQGPQGDTGAQGPAGPPGTSLASLDDLMGTPCNNRTGILSVQYDAARGGAVTLTCAATTTYLLTVTTSGGGTVTSDRGGISCSPTCSQRYGDGTVVQLTAAPSSGWEFAGWSGACTGTGTCSVTLGADTTVAALFRARLTVRVTGAEYSVPYTCGLGQTCYRTEYTGGSVTSQPGGISCHNTGRDTVSCAAVFDPGTVVTLTASPNSDARFGGFGYTGCGTAPTCTVTMSEPRSVSVFFHAQ